MCFRRLLPGEEALWTTAAGGSPGQGLGDRLPVLVGAWLGGRGLGERVEGATRRGRPWGLQGSASHSSRCLSFLVPGERCREKKGVRLPPALFFLFQDSFLSGF